MRADVRAASSACFSFCCRILFSPRPPPLACRVFVPSLCVPHHSLLDISPLSSHLLDGHTCVHFF